MRRRVQLQLWTTTQDNVTRMPAWQAVSRLTLCISGPSNAKPVLRQVMRPNINHTAALWVLLGLRCYTASTGDTRVSLSHHRQCVSATFAVPRMLQR
jgi:hypothetical protein